MHAVESLARMMFCINAEGRQELRMKTKAHEPDVSLVTLSKARNESVVGRA
jgi:hypothetical protein